jgi:hypothetical protein
MCNFELTFDMTILILQYFSFLDDSLCFYFILLFIDLIIEPILFKREELHMRDDFQQFVLFDLHFLFELQLGVEVFLSQSLHIHTVAIGTLLN